MTLPVVVRRYPALLLAATLAIGTHLARWSEGEPAPARAPAVTRLAGVVLPGVAVLPDRIVLRVRPESVEPADCSRVAVFVHSTVFDLRTFFDPPLRPGDRITVRGELRPVRNYQVPGVADRRRSAAARGCDRQLRLKSPLQLSRRDPAWWGRLLGPFFRYSESFAEALASRLDPSSLSVSLAMFLGRRELLGSSTRQRARELGLWHLYVVSGFHVGVIALLARLATRRLGWVHLPIVAASTWLYAVLAGLAVSTVRAAAALSFMLLVEGLRIRIRSANALGGVLVLLAAVDPSALTSPGLHFTVACLGGLLLGAPLAATWRRILSSAVGSLDRPPLSVGRRPADRASRRFRFRLELLLRDSGDLLRWGAIALATLLSWCGASLLLSLAAVAAVAPLTLFYGNLLTPSAVLTNLAALPLASALIALLSACFLLYWTPVGPPLLELAGLLASTFDMLVQAIAELAGPLYEPHPHWAQLLGYWAGLAIVFRAARRRIGWLYFLPLLPLLLLPSPSTPPDGLLRLTLIDVGQGEAIHLRYPDGSHALVDSGGQPAATDSDFVGRQLVARYLWHQGARTLADAVLTHSDADHSQGFEFLARAFPIRRFVTGPGEVDPPAPLAGRRVRVAPPGAWRRSSVEHRVLHPPRQVKDLGSNDSSLVLRLQFGDFSVLLTGDVTSRIEAGLKPAPVTVLKVAHHGSRSSTSAAFLRAARPRLALISAGRRNVFGHPSAEVLRRLHAAGAQVLTTADNGTLRVTSDGRNWWVQRYNGWAGRWQRVAAGASRPAPVTESSFPADRSVPGRAAAGGSPGAFRTSPPIDAFGKASGHSPPAGRARDAPRQAARPPAVSPADRPAR